MAENEQPDDMKYTCARIEQLATAIANGEAGALATFWDELEREGTPIVDIDDNDPSQCLVTFVWRETGPTDDVLLREVCTNLPQDKRKLRKLADTDVWYLTWRIASTIRMTYGFTVVPPGGMVGDLRFQPVTPDPLCKTRQSDDWQDVESSAELKLDSVLALPDAQPLPWLEPQAGIPTGAVSEHTFASDILGNERRVWVYQPAGHTAESEPVGFVLIFDGERHHSSHIVLDNLIAAGKIPPLAAILVHQLDLRNVELPGNPEFSRAMVEELMPWARETFNLTADPNRAIITGRSFGGLCSAYTALKHPDVFANVLMQSASCWYHPSLLEGMQSFSHTGHSGVVGAIPPSPLIITEFSESPVVPIRIYQEVGSQELGPPIAQHLQTFANRHFYDLARGKGYEITCREFNGGHDDAWWRGTLADGLLELTSAW
ncbi:MAG: alpha/beta hydrolase-fold protein [Thermomicrobiales bacterium]|nr:alpha/beta hydrolase-fold protein [Thermomicrobiales bacterium]